MTAPELAATDGTAAPPSDDLSLEISGGSATISLKAAASRQERPMSDTLRLAERLRFIVEACLQPGSSVAVVFLQVTGASPSRSNSLMAAEPDQEDTSFHLLVDLLSRLPQPLIGLADGAISALGTGLLSGCDLVIATIGTVLQLGDHLTIDAARASKVGLVGCEIIQGTGADALRTKIEELKALYSGRSQAESIALKQELQTAQTAPLKRFMPPRPAVDVVAEGAEGAEVEQQRDRAFEVSEEEPAKLPGLWLGCGWGPPQWAGTEKALSGGISPSPPGLAAPGTKLKAAGKPGGAPGGPKKKDLFQQYFNHDGPITTLMVANIPCRITQQQLIEAVEAVGFGEKYDFLYLPMGCRSSSAKTSNLGYGFINFVCPDDAAQFAQTFRGFEFKGTCSTKLCTVRTAHIQGLAGNLRHYGRAAGQNRPRGVFVSPVVKLSPTGSPVHLEELGLVCFDAEDEAQSEPSLGEDACPAPAGRQSGLPPARAQTPSGPDAAGHATTRGWDGSIAGHDQGWNRPVAGTWVGAGQPQAGWGAGAWRSSWQADVDLPSAYMARAAPRGWSDHGAPNGAGHLPTLVGAGGDWSVLHRMRL